MRKVGGREREESQDEACNGASTCGRKGQLREGKCLHSGDVRDLSNEVLQLAVCDEQGRVFGHGANYGGG
jgi:hypothetical protein